LALADRLLADGSEFAEVGIDEAATEALMAAAPDLLAALERVLAHGERLDLYYERGEDVEAVKQARAAIGKATQADGHRSLANRLLDDSGALS
jgi:hypothetical protein